MGKAVSPSSTADSAAWDANGEAGVGAASVIRSTCGRGRSGDSLASSVLPSMSVARAHLVAYERNDNVGVGLALQLVDPCFGLFQRGLSVMRGLRNVSAAGERGGVGTSTLSRTALVISYTTTAAAAFR